MPPGTTICHVHLYVANLEETRRFYRDILGFGDMGLAGSFRMGMVSAGGYHHHIGFNTWVGEGAPPPPPGSLGLRYITVVLPDSAELSAAVQRLQQAGTEMTQMDSGVLVRDPSQNSVLITTRR